MKKSPKKIIDVKEDGSTTIQLELENSFLEFYKKETGHQHVTVKGLSKFINHLIELHHNY